VFDDDPAKIGREIDGVPIVSTRDIAREVKARSIQIAILAIPADAAQAVTDQLVAAGIKSVLNFAPARLRVSKDARLKNVDLSIELETLSFYLAQAACYRRPEEDRKERVSRRPSGVERRAWYRGSFVRVRS
jgi:redox-sensing transcriptional repressor